MRFVATVAGQAHAVEIEALGAGYRVTVDEQVWDVDDRGVGTGMHSLRIDGTSYLAIVARGEGPESEGEIVVTVGGETHEVRVEEAARFAIRTRGGAGGAATGHVLKAPLPGKITRVAVHPGDAVSRGDTLLIIEAMKMENEFKAAAPGTVSEVHVSAGQAVNPGDLLVVIT
jgi:biotin carboxyl carrier protein